MKTGRMMIAALLAVCCHAAFAETPKAVVGVEKVTESEDMESRRYTGLVVSQSVVNLTPRVSGEILEVGFKDGDFVRKGEVLYRLDSVQYEAAVKSAEADIAETQAKLTYAEDNYNRNKLLHEKKAASLDAMESAKSTLEAEKAALLAMEAQLITAKDNLKHTVITSPLDGVAGVTNFTAGNYVTPGSGTLLTIIQVRPIRVRFSVSTADFLSMFGSPDELKNNGAVRIKLSDGREYGEAGEIELMNNEANSKTDAIQIYAKFANADVQLITGSTVSVAMSKKKGRTTAAVSPAAVMHDTKGSYVYVVDQANKVEKRYVTLGNATSNRQLIDSGLKKGETVIVKGSHKTMPGMEIEIETEG